MAKTSFLRMAINAGLKAELQELANAENRTLTNFIETKLRRVAAAPKGNRKSLVPPRQARAAHLTMGINVELKAKLQELATEDYRNLTDFIETLLRQVVAARKAKRKSPEIATAREAKWKTLMPRRQARAARLATCINAELKAELQELANQEYRTLADFIEMDLRQVVAARKAKRKGLMPRRQARAAHLTMRVNVELKANLQELANQQYRTLTDFIEIELHKVVVARKAKRESLIRR